MMQLASLAAENERPAPKHMTAFQLTRLIDEIETSIERWRYISPSDDHGDNG
jgi:hypothetical protein